MNNFEDYLDSYNNNMHDIYFGSPPKVPGDLVCDIDLIRETFEEIISMLYGSKPFDITELDDHLNYIARELDVELPVHNPKIKYVEDQDE